MHATVRQTFPPGSRYADCAFKHVEGIHRCVGVSIEAMDVKTARRTDG
jgi:hypothetical protein